MTDSAMTAMRERLATVRSALFVPASNPRAVAKARALPSDMVILDLEDAVPAAAKALARDAAVAAVGEGFGDRLAAIRLNAVGTAWHRDDCDALAASAVAVVVVPKVEDTGALDELASRVARPLIAMIESPAGLYAARAIAAHPGVIGLFAGTNDLAAALGLGGDVRMGLTLALQAIVLAAAAAGKPALDGVCNHLDDPAHMIREVAQARSFGFSGKTLIHPAQVDAANAGFAPEPAEVAAAARLIDAWRGGATRFEGRMIEAMHVAAARRLIARGGGGSAA